MPCVLYYHYNYFIDLIRKLCNIYEFIFDYTNKTYPLKIKTYRGEIEKLNIDKILYCNSPRNYPTHIFIQKFHCKFLVTLKINNCKSLV